MKALQFAASGSLDNLNLIDQPRPRLSPGEVLVNIKAAGLNTSDVSNVLGKHPYTTLPRIPGRDFAGVIVEGSSDLLGREVWGTGCEFGFTRDGSFAAFICAPADGVAKKPASLSFAQAAACGVPLITAWTGLERSQVRGGCRMLVLGAAGGVGSAAVKLGRWLGAEVVAVVRQAEQASALESQGIATLHLKSGESIAHAAKNILGNGFDVVFEATGALLAEAVPLLAPFGRVVVIVSHGDGNVNVPVRDLYRRAGSIVGVNSLLYSATDCAKILARLGPAFDSGELSPPAAIVQRTFDNAIGTFRELQRGARCKFVFTA
ncbi:MAG: zinc-binding alcohol dehydrogenase family protein [Burkholderiales bacterium]